jgi:hypothetical protein
MTIGWIKQEQMCVFENFQKYKKYIKVDLMPTQHQQTIMNIDSLRHIIARGRSANSYHEQFACVRDAISTVNDALQRITDHMYPFTADHNSLFPNCYYELGVEFLYDANHENQGEPLFLAPSRCNKFILTLYLVNVHNVHERYVVSSKWHSSRDGAMYVYQLPVYDIFVKVDSEPESLTQTLSDLGVDDNDGSRKALGDIFITKNQDAENLKRVDTMFDSNSEYFSGMSIGALLFNLSVVVMTITRNNMPVWKYNLATDHMCVPYEVISELYQVEDKTGSTVPALFAQNPYALPHQYMQGLLEAETKNRREEEIQRRFHDISNREEASKKRCLIEVGCEDTDLRLDLYVDLMLTNVAKYVSRIERGMSQKSIPVNMLKAAVVPR